MKILIVPMAAMAETSGTFSRTITMAKDLMKSGFEVALCAAKDINYKPIQGVVNYDLLKKSIGEIRKAIREFQPDVIYSEFNISAIIAARKENTRLFISASVPTQYTYGGTPKYAKGVNRMLKELQLPSVKSSLELFTWADLKFVPSCYELEPFDDDKVIFCGALKKNPPVYMGNGTISQKKMVKTNVQAFENSAYEISLDANQIIRALNRELLPQVEIITSWNADNDKYYAPGALVRIKNGKNMLSAKFSEEPKRATFYTLMFQDKPLFQFQGDEYYCPTCEKIVRSGYQLEQTEEFHIEKLNQEHTSFEEAFHEIIPLLGLLMDNYYIILDTKLYPTDGNGNLFWKVPNREERLPGSCLYYRGNGEWGKSRPHYAIATQSPNKLCKERVEYYRSRPDCRAVAYYMDGYMTALIDGHHKAMAAALEHKQVNALVIVPCEVWNQRKENGEFETYLGIDDIRFSCEEYALEKIPRHMGEKIPSKEMERIQKMIPKETQYFEFPYDVENLTAYYPDVAEVACMDEAGEITEEQLDAIVAERKKMNYDELGTFFQALSGLKHKRLLEMADYFLRKSSYISFSRVHDTDTMTGIVRELMKLPRTEELESFLIEIMVEYEGEYPTLREIIVDYL